MSNEAAPDSTTASPTGEARAQWREERTTFQRIYDVITGTTDYTAAKRIGERAECSTDGARAALSQLTEMGIVEQRGERPTEYRRNESYFRWKRIDTLARDHSLGSLREQLEALFDEDQAFQEQFDAPDPDAISPTIFESVDHDTVHERWEALTRWRTVREDLEVLQQAIHRVERDTNDGTETSASA